MLKKKHIYIIISAIIIGLSIGLSVLLINVKKIDFHYANGQIGIVTNYKDVKMNDEELNLYKTTSKKVELEFDTFNMYEEFDNYILINDKHKINISPSTNKQNEYINNKIEILGLNIIDGKINIKFYAGKNNKDIVDTFWLKNVVLNVDGKKYKSEIDKQISYERVINLGSPKLKSILRRDYVSYESFDFKIDEKQLKEKGTLLNNNEQKIKFQTNKKELELKNPIYMNFETSIKNGDIISETTQLKVDFSENVNSYKLVLNGIEINNNLKLNKEAWSVGDNTLEIIAMNDKGFIKSETIEFVLVEDNISNKQNEFKAYDLGVEKLTNEIKEGKTINNITDYESKFSDQSNISFIVENNDRGNFIWKGKSVNNRTVYLQIYNHELNKWETKSSVFIKDEEEIKTLGYNYKDQKEYIKNNEVNIRIVSENFTEVNIIDKYIYHATDVQYISRNGTIEISSIAETATKSLNEMAEHMIDMYENDLLEYVVMTGDFVQSTVKTGDIEWPIVMDNFINPLLDADVPIGTVSGNHDVGALNENTSEGSNALDEFLIYDLWNEHLGEHVFKDKSYYGGSFENNRSHYDLIDINSHEFLFLYLGWGSSIKGIHVSEKDIEYGKQVLEQYPNKTVVLALHDYMGNKSNRTVTGEFVYRQLVEKYSNIKFVLSGHVNGSSGRIDYIDDNGDGIKDRRVFQLLTNFQEEAIENLGATFIRRLGFDFTNNRINFDLYSPVAEDYQIFVANNAQYVYDYTNYNYDFDLNNIGYGLKTLNVGG